uniref:CCDC22 N-terminal domain-containing protein n=1 Tax=Anopheles atroparvus TaxID=41427 RepID=A0AAG5DW12_ANOAO
MLQSKSFTISNYNQSFNVRCEPVRQVFYHRMISSGRPSRSEHPHRGDGSSLAGKYKQLAYQPDCMVYGHRCDSGYQTFLYSNVAEVRRVFMFLIEQLPKETTDSTGTETPVDRVTDLENRIVENMHQQLRSSWRKDHQGSPLDLQQGGRLGRGIAKIPFVTQSDVTEEIKVLFDFGRNLLSRKSFRMAACHHRLEKISSLRSTKG